jgi:hypothetical protein
LQKPLLASVRNRADAAHAALVLVLDENGLPVAYRRGC